MPANWVTAYSCRCEQRCLPQTAEGFPPVNPLEQRMIVLGALEAVDWVVSFEEDTPQRLIAGILPDLLVKGGDYKPEEIAGSKEVWANGGEVLVLSTRRLLDD